MSGVDPDWCAPSTKLDVARANRWMVFMDMLGVGTMGDSEVA